MPCTCASDISSPPKPPTKLYVGTPTAACCSAEFTFVNTVPSAPNDTSFSSTPTAFAPRSASAMSALGMGRR